MTRLRTESIWYLLAKRMIPVNRDGLPGSRRGKDSALQNEEIAQFQTEKHFESSTLPWIVKYGKQAL